MPLGGLAHRIKKAKAKWSMTVMMNARDLSRDDDFLSHLLVEHLGTDDSPLQVHKMDPSRRLPKHDPADVLAIVKKYVVRRGGSSTSAHRVKRAVDALLELNAVKQYLHKRSTAQINAFATHASRYFELYLPTGSIEISHTSRYSHRTGKSELCILATTSLKVGQVISDLKGSLAHLTTEEDEELKKTDSRRKDGGIRRDFSVIHSNQKNKSHLFLGPARFVNHDCDHNVELFRDGRVITFRVIKPIAAGQEVTAHYGEGYFGKGNRHCLCQTCERHGRGGYTPQEADSDQEVEDDSSTDEETREQRIKAGLGLTAKGNPNERRTRRGVYAILPEEDTDDEDRVGATETVATQIPARSVGSCMNNGKVENAVNQASGATAASSPSDLTSLSSASSALPSSKTGDSSPKHDDKGVSDTSSALTSLPDNGKAAYRLAGESIPSLPKHPQRLTSLSSLSSVSSVVSSMPTSSLQKSIPAESVLTPSTPATSRMSTRSSTASQSKGKSKEESSPPGLTCMGEVETVSRLGKRALRSSRVIAALSGSSKERSKRSDSSSQDPNARPARQPRHSLPSGPAVPNGVNQGTSEAKRSSSLGTKSFANKSQSKSTTPVAGTTNRVTQAALKPQSNVPRCDTCANELSHLKGFKGPKNVVHSCVRCKRHFAIFGAPWPSRNAALEMPSSLSSDSSSNETMVEVLRQKLKDVTSYGHKFKYSRKYFEVKHPAMERSVKRRKTDSVLYSAAYKFEYHHADDQLRGVSGKFDKSGKMKRHLGYSYKLTIPGGAQRTRYLGIGDKRRWGDTFQDAEEQASESLLRSRRTIRRMGSVPTLPVAKPLAALCIRPTPNSFARTAWATSTYSTGGDPSRETSSDLTDLPEPEPKSIPAISRKRKRESLPSEPKPKPGRTFYMKDESKPMPKGWVLVTDSSEETGEDDDEGGQAHSETLTGGKPQLGSSRSSEAQAMESGQNTMYLASAPDSASGSTPSLAQTPSSRATSTPTQSSGTLVDDQPNAVPELSNPPVIAYSLRRSTISRTPYIRQSPKRRKFGGEKNAGTSTGKSQGVNLRQETDPIPEGHDHKLLVDSFAEMTSDDITPDTSSLTAPNNGSGANEGDEAPTKQETFQEIFAPPSGFTAKGEQISVAVPDSEGACAARLEKYAALTTLVTLEVPDSESKRTALEVSNIIHGTAFSYGLPDARNTWKPKYRYSELDGWNSDIETCL